LPTWKKWFWNAGLLAFFSASSFLNSSSFFLVVENVENGRGGLFFGCLVGIFDWLYQSAC
jgi:hypothetical protein